MPKLVEWACHKKAVQNDLEKDIDFSNVNMSHNIGGALDISKNKVAIKRMVSMRY